MSRNDNEGELIILHYPPDLNCGDISDKGFAVQGLIHMGLTGKDMV
jgi:hypothetical protein